MCYWPWEAFFMAHPPRGTAGVVRIQFCTCEACERGVKRQRLNLDFDPRLYPFGWPGESWWDEAESVVYPCRVRSK